MSWSEGSNLAVRWLQRRGKRNLKRSRDPWAPTLILLFLILMLSLFSSPQLSNLPNLLPLLALTMRLDHFLSAGVVILGSSATAYLKPSCGQYLNNLLPSRSLVARQSPDLIVTSDFLRRGYQACEQLHVKSI